MKNYLLTLEYDGTNFHGWQKQPGKRTVQGELTSALSFVCRGDVNLHGVSRTDAGVHAFGQRAGFRGDFSIPADRLMLAVNNLLGSGGVRGGKPGDLRVKAAVDVPEGFHARYDAVGKKYIYRIMTARCPDIFSRGLCWQIRESPDPDAMREAAAYLEGRHDFQAFRSAGGKDTRDAVRTIHGLRVYSGGGQTLSLEITGDGFLYNMVRIITGTLLMAGTGRIKPGDAGEILASKDRGMAGPTAPPQGLYLAEVYYKADEMKAAAGRRFAIPDAARRAFPEAILDAVPNVPDVR
jgi:tRNA pseudouridine38-40 synthase